MKLHLISGSLNVPVPQPFSEIPPPFGHQVIAYRAAKTNRAREDMPAQSTQQKAVHLAPALQMMVRNRRALFPGILIASGLVFLLGIFIQMRSDTQTAAPALEHFSVSLPKEQAQRQHGDRCGRSRLHCEAMEPAPQRAQNTKDGAATPGKPLKNVPEVPLIADQPAPAVQRIAPIPPAPAQPLPNKARKAAAPAQMRWAKAASRSAPQALEVQFHMPPQPSFKAALPVNPTLLSVNTAQ